MSSDEEAELNSNKELIGKNSFNFYHKNPDFFLQIKNSKQYDKPYCILNIIVNLHTYDNGTKYYYINYEWNYSLHGKIFTHEKILNSPCKKKDQIFSLNPHFDDKLFYENHIEGEIIIKNSLSEQLIKYLLMDIKELSKYCGNSDPLYYKANIMKSISFLWD